MVEAVAASTQTDPAMAAMFSLGFASAAIARKAVLERPSGGSDPLNLWVLVIAPSGENKSAVFNEMVEPIEAVQTLTEAGDPGPENDLPVRPSEPQHRSSRWEIVSHRDVLADEPDDDPSEGLDIRSILHTLRSEQERLHPGEPLNFVTRDITPESVVQMMASQWLGVLQAAPEAGFSSLIGKSAKATGHLANLNLAWDGGNIRVRRVTRSTTTVHRAALTMVFSPQPDAFRVASGNRLLRETGYLPRFLVCFPEVRRGTRRAPFAPVPPPTVQRYHRNIWAMLALGGEDEVPAIRMSGGAVTTSNDFFNEMEPQLAPGQPLAGVSDWVEKLRLNALRIAGVLHVANHAAREGVDTFREPLSRETMEAAVEICRWLIPHGQRAFAGLTSGADGRDLSAAVLEVILNRDYLRLEEFTARDVHRASQSQFEHASDVTAGLEGLVEQGVLGRRRVRRRMMYRLGVPDEDQNDSDS